MAVEDCGMLVDMYIDMCIDICIDTCIHLYLSVRANICGLEYRHA